MRTTKDFEARSFEQLRGQQHQQQTCQQLQPRIQQYASFTSPQSLKPSREQNIRVSKSEGNLQRITFHSLEENKANASEQLETYQLVNVLKQDRGQVVYTALDSYNKEMVVIKLVQTEECGADRLKRFYKETQILSQLNRREGIVQLLGTINEEPYKGVVLQYCRFQSLQSILQIIKCPLHEYTVATDVIWGLLNAVLQAHAEGIIHGTIQPEHILFDESMQVRLCGFSNAVEVRTELPYYRLGHPPYTAPEILNKPYIDQIFHTVVVKGMDESDLPQYNQKADVWSIGILTVELLLGHNPFLICTDWDSLQKQVKNFLQKDLNKGGKLAGVSTITKDFLRSCLKTNPDERMSPSQLLDHQFFTQMKTIPFSKRITLVHVIQEHVQQASFS